MAGELEIILDEKLKHDERSARLRILKTLSKFLSPPMISSKAVCACHSFDTNFASP